MNIYYFSLHIWVSFCQIGALPNFDANVKINILFKILDGKHCTHKLSAGLLNMGIQANTL